MDPRQDVWAEENWTTSKSKVLGKNYKFIEIFLKIAHYTCLRETKGNISTNIIEVC